MRLLAAAGAALSLIMVRSRKEATTVRGEVEEMLQERDEKIQNLEELMQTMMKMLMAKEEKIQKLEDCMEKMQADRQPRSREGEAADTEGGIPARNGGYTRKKEVG